MNYSFVFLGDRDKKKILGEFSSKIKLFPTNYQVVFLTNKPYKKENLSSITSQINFRTIVYNQIATNEEMFETFIQRDNIGTVILFKENAVSVNFNDVNKFIDLNTKGAMLVVSKQRKNSNIVKTTFNLVKNFCVKLFLGVRLFESDAEIILLDKILVSTMKEMPGKSASLTKINSWAGIEPKYVIIDEQPKKLEKLSIRVFVPFIITSFVFLLFIVGDILFAVLNVNIPFLLLFLYIIVQVAVVAFALYTLTRSVFRVKYGNIRYVSNADITEEIDNFDD